MAPALSREVVLALALLACAPAQAQTELCELSGPGWNGGQHQGTRIERERLTLAPGTQRGHYVRALPPGRAFDSLLLSLNHDPFPPGCRVETHVRVRVGERWSAWLDLGAYGPGGTLPRSGPAAPARPDALARVLTDLVRTRSAAGGAEVRLTLHRGARSPSVRRLAVARWTKAAPKLPPARRHPAWGRTLQVPERSQQVVREEIRSRICSPTSLSMVMAFHERPLPTEDVADAVYDRAADIYGNWSFNVAFAGARGFDATATRLDGFAELEAEIAAGRPVVLSHRFKEGELRGAPMRATVGHLIVVVGFTEAGDVVVNDPAAHPDRGPIRRVYARAELHRSWQVNAEGVVYLLTPR